MKRYAIIGGRGTTFAILNTYATAKQAERAALKWGLKTYRIVTVNL